jgi:type II secretory pathway pseudopilin PulG
MKNAAADKLVFKYFTIVELLVVISIIAILASMLLPSLSRSQELAKDIKCKGQFRQYGTALFMYADDYNDSLGGVFVHGGSVAVGGAHPTFPTLYNPYIEGRDNITGKSDVLLCPFIKANYAASNVYVNYKCSIWWNCCKIGCNRVPGVVVINDTTRGDLGPARKISKVKAPSVAQIFRDAYPKEHFAKNYKSCGSPITFVDGHVGFGTYYGNSNSMEMQNNYRGWDAYPTYTY